MTPDDLRERRRALGLSQIDLARELGVNYRTVSDWERGINGIPGPLDLALRCLEIRAGLRPPEAA